MIDKFIDKILYFFLRKYLLKFPSLKQFVKFSFVGVINTLIDFVVYCALTRLIHFFAVYYLMANAISFSCAVTNSFILNKRWTFKDLSKEQLHLKYLKFFLVNIFSLAIVEILLFLLVNKLGIYDLFAKVIVLLYYVVSNFFLSKLWVFRK